MENLSLKLNSYEILTDTEQFDIAGGIVITGTLVITGANVAAGFGFLAGNVLFRN